MRVGLILEYEGTKYAGFQRQVDHPTIQSKVEESIRLLTGAASLVSGAGRTDSGVHAAGQVVAFDLHKVFPLEKLLGGLNAYLPYDIAVKAVYEVPLDFDPRRHAISRVYRYTIQVGKIRSPFRRRYVYAIKGPVDVDLMSKALSLIEGSHDFAAFAGRMEPGKSTRRTVLRTLVWHDGPEVYVEIEGSAFLPQQMRRTVGALLKVGTGAKHYTDLLDLVNHGKEGEASWVIPAKGLCLVKVKYQRFPPINYANSTNYKALAINEANT